MNIVLIVCDTLRADHLGCYGYFRDTSPNMDGLAREGVLFEDYYNSGVPTGPGFTSMFTGLYPINHKYYMFNAPNVREVDDTVFTMAEIFQTLGLRTAAIDNLMNFSSHSKHWVRGYNFYFNPSSGPFTPPYLLKADEANKVVIPWIENYSDEEFFLFLHYWDPHLPYNQPVEFRDKFCHKKGEISDLRIEKSNCGYEYVPGWGRVGEYSDGLVEWRRSKVSIELYDGEISYMDKAIGEVVAVLEEKGLLNNTLLVITSDHGEHLGQHYSPMEWQHNSLHETIIHLPLIMRLPGKLSGGLRIEGFCQQIDLLPTISEIAGFQPNISGIDGVSMLPLLDNNKIRNSMFIEYSSGQRALRFGDWKIIDDEWVGKLHRPLEIYNVKDDPMEAVNLAETEKKLANELLKTLYEWVKKNLHEGEDDPAVLREDSSAGLDRNREKMFEFRKKTRELNESLGIVRQRR